ncbi:hypothetical protein EDC96DRAFT_577790 [Choanephora cucurbitarum]|nr:hypothetical protein EDC96DRAFT_577790 [Choanephora cucurbitarum]
MYIKPDPEQQEEQEDLIMSYLNADYLATETPLSPPSSDSSLSTGSPEKHSVDDFMLDIQSTDFLAGVMDDQSSYHPHLFNPCLPQQHQQQQQQSNDLSNGFSFFLPSDHFIAPFPVPPVPSNTLIPTPMVEEQPKKKRGRKKREPVMPITSPAQPSLLAPKPLAPRPLLVSEDNSIKSEPTLLDTPLLAGPTPDLKKEESSEEPAGKKTIDPQTQEAMKQAQIQKRQERLIKNRAAALLSRKRKREHLTSLEEEKQTLLQQKEQLNQKVDLLETRISSLESENRDLKEQLKQYQQANTIISMDNLPKKSVPHSPKPSKATTGVVFMIILFSFALFSLPSSRTTGRLTVGGGSSSDTKKQFPLIDSSLKSEETYCDGYYCSPPSTTDLVLIDSVQPRDLQTWINQKLDSEVINDNNNKLISWFPQRREEKKESSDHVYLYSKEFTQLASLHTAQKMSEEQPTQLPTISLISPYNLTVPEDQCDSYLQIDVQVLRSTVIKGQLMSLQQFGPGSVALLDGMKDELIANATQKRRHMKRQTKKIARVIS